MKRILWVSRHEMHPVQMGALTRLFGGDVCVTPDPQPFTNAEEIARRFHSGGFDDMIVVAPLSVIARLVDLGIRPLWAEAEIVGGEATADWSVKNRYYRFTRFRRITGLEIRFEDLGPAAARCAED